MLIRADSLSYQWDESRSIRLRALARFRLTVNGDPEPRAFVRAVPVDDEAPEVRHRHVGQGVHVLYARPELAPLGPVALSVTGPGLRPSSFTLRLTSTLVDAGDLAISPVPIRVIGTVRSTDGALVPGASVTLADPRAGGPTPVALHTPVAQDHPIGARVEERTAVEGADLELQSEARAGQSYLRFADRGTLAAGDLVRFGPLERRSYARVRAQPSARQLVRLAADLVRGTAGPVRRVTLDPPSTSATLARPARRGDGILWLSTPLAGTLRVEDEVVQAGLPLVDGGFVLDGVADDVVIRAVATGFSQERPYVFRPHAPAAPIVSLVLKPE